MVMYYIIFCYVIYPVLYAMLNPNYSEYVFFKGVGLWVISPILITAALCILIVGIPFALLFEFGTYIKRKL